VGESQKERQDRELIELLNELRVALPGVQVLFAFLLVVPFSQGFPKVTSPQKTVYFISFLCTAVASALLIAPSAHHRIQFRAHDKEQLLLVANKLAIAGLFFLSVAITCVVFVITDYLYGGFAAQATTVATAFVFLGLWFALPIARKLSDPDNDPS
jgi:hypothetical protein